MSCPYCKYNDSDQEQYRNEPIVSRDDLLVSMLYAGELVVWLPLESGCLAIRAAIPIEHCPMCGRKL